MIGGNWKFNPNQNAFSRVIDIATSQRIFLLRARGSRDSREDRRERGRDRRRWEFVVAIQTRFRWCFLDASSRFPEKITKERASVHLRAHFDCHRDAGRRKARTRASGMLSRLLSPARFTANEKELSRLHRSRQRRRRSRFEISSEARRALCVLDLDSVLLFFQARDRLS